MKTINFKLSVALPSKAHYEVLTRLVDFFSSKTKKGQVSVDIAIIVNEAKVQFEKDLSFLKESTSDFPLIRLSSFEYPSSEVSTFQADFNKFFDAFIYEINGGDRAINYYSPGLKKLEGNNNLDIIQNKNSAALLYIL